AAREFAAQQMVEVRSDVQELSDGLFRRLEQIEPALVAQVREALPQLVVEAARRLFSGFEPTAKQVETICLQTLDQLYPETKNLELRLCPRDMDLLESLNPTWFRRYPKLTVTRDAHLAAGDCVVHSRFGVTDARIEAKIENLAHEFAAAS